MFKLRAAVTRATQRQAESPSAAAAAVFDAIRHASALASRTLQAEHALFHSLFVSPPPNSSGGAPASASGSNSAAVSVWSGGMPAHLRATSDATLSAAMDDIACLVVDTLRPLILQLGSQGPASTSLATLADIVCVLRDEVILGLAVPRGAPLAPLARAVSGLVRDVQVSRETAAMGFASLSNHSVDISLWLKFVAFAGATCVSFAGCHRSFGRGIPLR